jgi:hypothetical protein
MTKQETFKKRVRARMAKTGERYGAARRALLPPATGGGRAWVAEPEATDEAVREATGRGWDEWCDLVDAWPGHDGGHAAVATWLREEHGVPGWWAQSVTVGWERITGRRLRHQRSDGTFNANRTRTVRIDRDELRRLLLDDGDRADLFPGLEVELRSKPTSKALRLGVGPGVALIALDPLDDGRTRISVAHERLPTAEAVDEWKAFWGEWLAAVEDAAVG